MIQKKIKKILNQTKKLKINKIKKQILNNYFKKLKDKLK